MRIRELLGNNILRAARYCAVMIVSGVTVMCLGGCTPEATNVGQAQELTGEEYITDSASDAVIYTSYSYLPVGTYDSADTAILKSINTEERTVTLYNTVAAKTYTLNFDGTTYASDKYGTAMSMEQMSEGTIVNVNFYKATRQLVNIQVSPDAWTYEEVTRYDLGGINSTATIGDRTYALTKGVQVFSEGKQTDIMNIVDGDSITVSGIGYDIYSIKVNSGHGYVRLTQDEALIGGWVEIGGTLITKITEPGMLLTVPEGTYTVRMYNDSSSVTEEINVERNQELILNCSGVTAPVETIGSIIFHVTPDTAVLTMDGEIKDISGMVRAPYGIHQIEVSASGYDTLSRYVNVGTELAEITINLDESVAYTSGNSSLPYDLTNSGQNATAGKTSASGNKTSGNSSSANTSANSVSSNKKTLVTGKYNRVYIYSPENVEIYVDGIYAGLTPMSFKKTAGSHTVILKKSGYETRSYTIYLYDDGEDMSISFSALEEVSAASGSSSAAESTSTTSSSGGTSGSSSSSGSTTTQTGSQAASDSAGSGTASSSGSDTATGTDNTAGSTTTTGSDTTTDSSTVNETGTGMESGTTAGNGNVSGSGTNTGSGTTTEGGTDNTAGTSTGSNTDTGSGTVSDSGSGTGTGSDSSTPLTPDDGET